MTKRYAPYLLVFLALLGVTMFISIKVVQGANGYKDALEACQKENRRLNPEAQGFNEYALDPPIHLITAYSTDCGQGQSIDVSEWCDGLTATRIPVRRGICAASWDIFPPGTWLYIEGYGECVVLDTGGAMRQAGKRGIVHVDVFMDSRQEAMEWGRRG